MSILLLTTGGSIDKTYSTKSSSFVVGEPQIPGLLQDANASVDFDLEAILRKDSLEITEEDRQLIVEKVAASPQRHVIITHGTDTMLDTARALGGIRGKVIVLTGAMRPAAFRETDAVFNVGGAFVAVQLLPEGVYVVMGGKVFHPERARKNLELDRFEET